jgi:hypothetical protein
MAYNFQNPIIAIYNLQSGTLKLIEGYKNYKTNIFRIGKIIL